MAGLEHFGELSSKADRTGATFGSHSGSLNLSLCLDLRAGTGHEDHINASEMEQA